jgi:hypothetical protein
MCTVLLPPGDNPIAVNKYIIIHAVLAYQLREACRVRKTYECSILKKWEFEMDQEGLRIFFYIFIQLRKYERLHNVYIIQSQAWNIGHVT